VIALATQKPVSLTADKTAVHVSLTPERFDRRAYQRDYMRKRRADAKQAVAE